MRGPMMTLLLLGLAGCAGTPTGSSSNGTAPSGPTLDTSVIGKVVSANPTLRFVVMDFPIRRIPVLDQHLNVYRQGRREGEVVVTGPILGTAAAGDIIAGQAEVGDEVRED